MNIIWFSLPVHPSGRVFDATEPCFDLLEYLSCLYGVDKWINCIENLVCIQGVGDSLGFFGNSSFLSALKEIEKGTWEVGKLGSRPRQDSWMKQSDFFC